MKRCSCILCAFVLILQLLCISTAFAEEKTFKEIIDQINSISYDGVKTFSVDNVTIFKGPDPNNFFTMKGAVLIWTIDSGDGMFWLFNKNNEKQVCIWYYVKKEHCDRVMDDLMKILPEYIDFDNGGKITFIITTNKQFDRPITQIEYSTVPSKKTSNYFTDPDAFCESVREAVYSTFLPR